MPATACRLLGYHSRQPVRQAKGSDHPASRMGRKLRFHLYPLYRTFFLPAGIRHLPAQSEGPWEKPSPEPGTLSRRLDGRDRTRRSRISPVSCRMDPAILSDFPWAETLRSVSPFGNPSTPISNLKEVFCISPALDPYKSTLAIDASSPVYRHYFLAKWKRSLRKKQRCFPDLYHFDDILHHNTCMGLTEAIMPYYTEFGHYMDYFRRYTLTGDVLASAAHAGHDLHLSG